MRAEGISSDDGAIDNAGGHSRQQGLRSLTSRTKGKAKKLLNLEKPDLHDTGARSPEESIVKDLDENPAFNPNKRVKPDRTSASGAAGKALGTLHTVAQTVAHPKDAIKSKATRATASKLSEVERPYLSEEADLDRLQAHVNLNEVESSSHIVPEDGEHRPEDKLREKVEDIEAHRESLHVAWVTSRHVDRVRVVPKKHMGFPKIEEFLEKDSEGHIVRENWEKWLGHILLYYTQGFTPQYIDDFNELPFDVDSVRHHVERLVVATAPWQAWAMNVRSVYRWESPTRTGKWLAIYVVLWYTQHLVAFLWAYIIYIVVKRRYFSANTKSLRESMDRALNRGNTAYKFGELINKHGREEWLEPLIDEMGPYVQLQLNDAANMLEVLANFYAWKVPRKTANSLVFFAACLSLALFADMTFCMKVVSFIGGGGFFLCWPIASLYPKYRLLVSPFKWVLWDIPTDAEWSFQYLRKQAQEVREKMIGRSVDDNYMIEKTNPGSQTYTGKITISKRVPIGPPERSEVLTDDDDSETEYWQSVGSSSGILEGQDIISFRAQWNRKVGRLVVYPSGIRFVQSLPKKELWNRRFLDLLEMKKLPRSTVSKLTLKALQQLQFTCTDGTMMDIEAIKDRDEAFNTIIGFSGLQWQVLQRGLGQHGKGIANGKI